MRPSHRKILLFGLLPVVFASVDIAHADQFEELHNEQIRFLRAKLDDRLLPSRTATAQSQLNRLTKLEVDAKVAANPNRPASVQKQELLTATDREVGAIWSDCDAKGNVLVERLQQAIRREQENISSFPKQISDPHQWSAYWKARSRLQSYLLLLGHAGKARDLVTLSYKSYLSAKNLLLRAPENQLDDVANLVRLTVPQVRDDCVEFAFTQDFYTATTRH